MTFSEGYALIIGVGSYARVPSMNVPVTKNDAEQVAKVLQDSSYCSYPASQVTFLHDETASRPSILTTLEQLAKQVLPTDTFVLFYAGHGQYGDDGDYYLTTNDTELNGNHKVLAGTGISSKEFLAWMKQIPARRAMLVLNACHSGATNPGTLGGLPDSLTNEQPTGQAVPDAVATALLGMGEGRVIITACRDTQYSYFAHNASTTLFGDAVVNGLQGNGISSSRGYISVFDFYEHVFDSVSTQVKARFNTVQEPELTISKGVGVMAVALYRGAQPQGTLGLDERPAIIHGKTREMEQDEIAKAFEQVQSGQLNAVVGRDMTGNTFVGENQYTIGDNVDARGVQGLITHPSGSVTQHFGEQRNINTGSDYAEGSIDKREGIFGGTFSGPAIGVMKGGTANFGLSLSASADRVGLQEIARQVQDAAYQAETRGDDDLATDLQGISINLAAAIKAYEQGKDDQRLKRLALARAALNTLAQNTPSVRGLALHLEEVQ